jgi:hypothetical protein
MRWALRSSSVVRGGPGPGLRVHAAWRRGQPRLRRHAAGFCLSRAHGGRAPLSRRQGQRQIVPLTHTLQTGDRVEILTAKRVPRATGCSRAWLPAYLPGPGQGAGLVSQPGARGKCRCGTALLEREFRRLALTSVDYKRIAAAVQLPTVEDMYAAVGSGDISASQVLNAAQALIGDKPQPQLRLSRGTGARHGAAVQVQGVGNLLTNMAGCCKPVPGDAITGFITQGRGVSIHRADCRRLCSSATAPGAGDRRRLGGGGGRALRGGYRHRGLRSAGPAARRDLRCLPTPASMSCRYRPRPTARPTRRRCA